MSLSDLVFCNDLIRRKGRLAQLAMKLWPSASLPTPYGPRLVKRTGDATFRLAVHGSYGDFISDLITGQDQPFDFIDIGANQGIYSLLAGAQRLCRSVLAFEPNPESFAYLVRNIALNQSDKVVPLCAAIADENTPCVRLAFVATHSGGASMMSGGGNVVALSANKAMLDAVWPRGDDHLRIAKIDVEGAECVVLSVLENASLLRTLDGIIVELNDLAAAEGHSLSVAAMLRAAGFFEARRSEGGDWCDAWFVRDDSRLAAAAMGGAH